MTNLNILYYMNSSGVFTFKEYITTLDAKYYNIVVQNLADLFNKKNFEVFDGTCNRLFICLVTNWRFLVEIFRQCIDMSFSDDRRYVFGGHISFINFLI